MSNQSELDEILLHLQRTASELSIAKGLTYKQVSQRRKYQRTRAKQALLDWHKEQIEAMRKRDREAELWYQDFTS